MSLEERYCTLAGKYGWSEAVLRQAEASGASEIDAEHYSPMPPAASVVVDEIDRRPNRRSSVGIRRRYWPSGTGSSKIPRAATSEDSSSSSSDDTAIGDGYYRKRNARLNLHTSTAMAAPAAASPEIRGGHAATATAAPSAVSPEIWGGHAATATAASATSPEAVVLGTLRKQALFAVASTPALAQKPCWSSRLVGLRNGSGAAADSPENISLIALRSQIAAMSGSARGGDDAVPSRVLADNDDEDFLVPDDVEDDLADSDSSSGSSARSSSGAAGRHPHTASVSVDCDTSDDDSGPVVRRRQVRKPPPIAAPRHCTIRSESGADFDFVADSSDDGSEDSAATEDVEDESGSPVAARESEDTPPARRLAPPSGRAPSRTPATAAAADTKAASRSKRPVLRDGDRDPSTGRVHISEEGGGVAARFRTAKQRDALTSALLAEYNARVFGGGLPAGLAVEWGKRLTRTAGLTYTSRERGGPGAQAPVAAGGGDSPAISARTASLCGGGSSRLSTSRELSGHRYSARIVLSTKVVDTPLKLAQTLLHELCHAAAWVIDGVNRPPHGAVFQKWGRAATRLYPQRPVTVCHTYEIAFKHHYTCTACGYIYGRHSKSIDTASTRCGRCGTGRLSLSAPGPGGPGAAALAENAAGADAATATPAPPRTPSAYQAFVAANRRAVAASLPPGTSSQQVMAALGQRWQQQKAAASSSTCDAAAGAGDLASLLESALLL